MVFEDCLKRNAELYPQKTAVVCGDTACTYEQLYQHTLVRMEELEKQYVKGQIVCVRVSSTIEYVVTYFALHMMGCVAAPMEHDMPEVAFELVRGQLEPLSTPKGTADVLYTTGTTGEPKGVMVSHQAIVADAENLIDGQGFTHELVFVVNGPLNHIGSLSKIYPVMMLGATLILVDGLKDINVFFKAFDYPASKMATFLVPASIRIILQFSADRLASYADKIDFIETGAAAISSGDMAHLCRILPNSRLYNTYASTETGIICTYNFNDGKCVAGCLGRPMKNSGIFITEQGMIACHGKTLMTGYAGEPERTLSVLRDGVVYTSDFGVSDAEGMLHLSGRMGDVINVGGFKVIPTDVEDAAMSFPGVRECVCISVEHPITGSALKLLVVMEEGLVLHKRALALHLKKQLETYKIPLLYEQVEAVRRTFNGKIDRKSYRESS